MLDKQEPKVVKTLLYAYRVVLTGTHLLRTGEIETNLPRLAELFAMRFIANLIAQKQREKVTASNLDWSFHEGQLDALEAAMERAFQESPLPEDRDRTAVNGFLVDYRLRNE